MLFFFFFFSLFHFFLLLSDVFPAFFNNGSGAVLKNFFSADKAKKIRSTAADRNQCVLLSAKDGKNDRTVFIFLCKNLCDHCFRLLSLKFCVNTLYTVSCDLLFVNNICRKKVKPSKKERRHKAADSFNGVSSFFNKD